MLARAAIRPSLTLVRGAGLPSNTVRTMATLKEIETRLKSVKNIEKITKSMKMIASAGLAKAQRAMGSAKLYGQANAELFKNTEATSEEPRKQLFVVISSDKGLCGGIHSSVSKATRGALSVAGGTSSSDSPVVIIGDKSKAQLTRTIPNNFVVTFNQIGRDVPTFADAAHVADLINKSGVEYDTVNIIYNKFISALSYEASTMEVLNAQLLKEAPGFKAYEMEDDVTKDLAEFSLANAIFAALVESHATEISARRNAMDNASKNAKDMIGSLQIKYNRGRQAAITNELIDIITGASAL